jgi:hypothetical protein
LISDRRNAAVRMKDAGSPRVSRIVGIEGGFARASERGPTAQERADVGGWLPPNRSALIRPMRASDEAEALFAPDSRAAIFCLSTPVPDARRGSRRDGVPDAGSVPMWMPGEFFDVQETRMK